MFEVMDVRAADSSLADLDQDLIAFDLGDRALRGVSAEPTEQASEPESLTFSYLTWSMA